MRTSKAVALGLSFVVSALASEAWAQQHSYNTAPILRPDRTHQPIIGSASYGVTSSRQDETQETQPSPSDRPAAPGAQDVPAPPVAGDQPPQGPSLQVQSNAATMPDSYYARRSQRPLGQPTRVFGQTPGGFTMGGWFDTGYYSDDDGIWNNFDDQYQLNQAWMYAERKAPRGCNFSFGFRFDAVYGTEAQYIQAIGNPPAGAPSGWDVDWDHGEYGWAIPQLYAEVARNRWSIIGGKYINPMGYESVMSPKNFFFSRSYARGKIQPQTFTGTHSRFDLTENTTILTGVSTNWDTGFTSFNDSLSYFGGFEYKPCAPINVNGYLAGGDFGYRGDDGWLTNLIVDVMVTDKLNYINEWTSVDSDIEYQFSWANYLIYRTSQRLGIGTRFEWFKSTIYTGTADSTYQWTAGLNARPHANITIRPELRVDWGTGATLPGNVIYASDVIITF
jgi:hypothetical protein